MRPPGRRVVRMSSTAASTTTTAAAASDAVADPARTNRNAASRNHSASSVRRGAREANRTANTIIASSAA